MAGQEQQRPQRRSDAPEESEEVAVPTTTSEAPADLGPGLPAGRDRRRPGDQLRGVRARVRPEGRSVSPDLGSGARLPAAFLASDTSSFVEFLGRHAPDALAPLTRAVRGPAGRPARDDHRRAGLRRRRRHGGRPAGHRGQRDRQPGHRQGPPRRRALRHRHRGRRRHRAGDDPAVPGRARALREARGHHAQPRGQGHPARRDGARQPGDGHAGPVRGPAVRRLGPRHRAAAGSSASTPPAGGTPSPTTTPSARGATSPAAR